MTAEATVTSSGTSSGSSSGSKRGVVLPILALVAVAAVVRLTFVDLLTKTTGTWMGGVESPHRDTNGPSAA